MAIETKEDCIHPLNFSTLAANDSNHGFRRDCLKMIRYSRYQRNKICNPFSLKEYD